MPRWGNSSVFYHTLIDWHNDVYKNNFSAYIDYLISSVEILCRHYGNIGGFWFDGMWEKPDADWQEDRLYAVIRKYQPEAMIINNTGLFELGKVGHPEIDSVTFERGNPSYIDCSDKHRAGEMCQILNDHWGYAKDDLNYKSTSELISNLIDCRRFNCNFLLNVGPMGSGNIKPLDKALIAEVGKWIRCNKNFIYDVKCASTEAENADVLTDGKYCYAVVKDVVMTANPDVQREGIIKEVLIKSDKPVKSAIWLDSGEEIDVKDNRFTASPFKYGTSRYARVARFEL